MLFARTRRSDFLKQSSAAQNIDVLEMWRKARAASARRQPRPMLGSAAGATYAVAWPRRINIIANCSAAVA